MAGNRPINPDGPGTTGTGKPKRPKQFPGSTPTAEGFLKPFANETYRRAYKKTQVQNERSGAKPVVQAANKERELQRIAARQRLKGDKFATVNSAKKQYNKRAKRFAKLGPKTDTTVGTRQRGFYNDTMDTSLNPLGGGPRPTQNRYLNTWVSPVTATPKRPSQVTVRTRGSQDSGAGGTYGRPYVENRTSTLVVPGKGGGKSTTTGTTTRSYADRYQKPVYDYTTKSQKGKRGVAQRGTRRTER
jgi:hypothetical protein